MSIDNVKSIAKVMDKEKAADQYDDAIASSKSTGLLEKIDQKENKKDIFKISLGNIQPSTRTVDIRLQYVVELSTATISSDEEAILFSLPVATIPSVDPLSNQKQQGKPEFHASVEITTPSFTEISRIESHPLACNPSIDSNTATMELSPPIESFHSDWTLRIITKRKNSNASDSSAYSLIESDDEGNRIMAIRMNYPQDTTTTSTISIATTSTSTTTPAKPTVELIFILDRSGSMSGSKIRAVRTAMNICLRSLPSDGSLLFNIVGFGSKYNALFQYSQPYNESTFAHAQKYLDSINADMGGTTLFTPLKAVLDDEPLEFRTGPAARIGITRHNNNNTKDGGGKIARQLLILTDGMVTRPEDVIALVRKHSSQTKIIAFGKSISISNYYD